MQRLEQTEAGEYGQQRNTDGQERHLRGVMGTGAKESGKERGTEADVLVGAPELPTYPNREVASVC